MSTRETVHDRMDRPDGSDPQAFEVWSNSPKDDEKPHIVLHAEAKSDWTFTEITPAEARLLAAMLVRAAERIEAMIKAES